MLEGLPRQSLTWFLACFGRRHILSTCIHNANGSFALVVYVRLQHKIKVDDVAVELCGRTIEDIGSVPPVFAPVPHIRGILAGLLASQKLLTQVFWQGPPHAVGKGNFYDGRPIVCQVLRQSLRLPR